MATKTRKPFIKMDCDVCKKTNYHLAVPKGKTIENKVSVKKFCKQCQKHTVHSMKLK